jgi:hypothetical protein
MLLYLDKKISIIESSNLSVQKITFIKDQIILILCFIIQIDHLDTNPNEIRLIIATF